MTMHALLFSGALRASLVLAAGLAACALLSRGSAATRRFVLVLTLGASIVVPLAAAVGPRWTVAAPAPLSAFAVDSDGAHATAASAITSEVALAPGEGSRPVAPSIVSRLDPTGVAVVAWLVVASALLLRVVASHLRVIAMVHRSTLVDRAAWAEAADAARQDGNGRTVEVRVSSELEAPAVAGLLRPTIVVPTAAREWPVERCRLVLVHEVAHVRRRDVLAQAIADVACALHWCNPLVWLTARRLRLEREVAADDAVLAAGVRPSRYAEELLAVATSAATPAAALAMAERSSLESRVASILSARLARAPLAASGTAAVLAVGAAIAAGAACASPVASASASASTAVGEAVAEPAPLPRTGTANDPAIQRAADEEVAAIAAQWSPALVTVVVLDPATGEVLANAGQLGGKAADVATTVATPPGSTMKAITMVAALDTRAITLDRPFEAGPDPRMYGDKALHDFGRAQGATDVTHLFAVSSNTGMSHVFDALGGDSLALYLHRFHLGSPLGLPGAAAGSVPAHIATGSYEGALAATGAGDVTATPMQMIAAYGAIAADGVYHAPTLDRGGSPSERIFSKETARSMMGLLDAVVLDPKGTGVEARVDGVHVAGKTGTTEWQAPDGREQMYASFIGIADLPARRVVALVGIGGTNDHLSGPAAAAPAFARLVKRLRGG